jgi:hypothetical protein
VSTELLDLRALGAISEDADPAAILVIRKGLRLFDGMSTDHSSGLMDELDELIIPVEGNDVWTRSK